MSKTLFFLSGGSERYAPVEWHFSPRNVILGGSQTVCPALFEWSQPLSTNCVSETSVSETCVSETSVSETSLSKTCVSKTSVCTFPGETGCARPLTENYSHVNGGINDPKRGAKRPLAPCTVQYLFAANDRVFIPGEEKT